MRDQEPSDHEELTGLAAQLAALTPRARLDRDQVMFVAGQASGSRLRSVNRLLVASNVACVALLAVLLVNLSAERVSLAERTPRPATNKNDLGPTSDAASGQNGSKDHRGESHVASVDAFTNFRMLQTFGRGPEVTPRRAADASAHADPGEALQPLGPRALLHRYLREQAERM